MTSQAWTILALPLAAFLVITFITRPSKNLSSWLAIGAIAVSTGLSWSIFALVLGGGVRDSADFEWLRLVPRGATGPIADSAGEGFLRLGIQVDALTALMLVVVTTVSLLVQLYSRGYMVEHGQKDPSYSRFFAYLSLFTFSMLGLVLANTLLLLFIFWELVGLSSYLLIGFWYHKPEAWIAAKKAFITTRVGDVGFLIGLLILWSAAGTLRFEGPGGLFELASQGTGPLFATQFLGQPVLFWAALGIFAGAVGKSGQFPLHVWLPDAMEGPTPVSALIHAATMVAAGVYLVARTFPLFEAAPSALTVVAIIGGFTAIFAATMGLVNNDIKRVLAFSTVSQLGYMMLALGAGSPAAAMFHLFTHAFFKALLFLSAGSVIHATGTNDIREMGGLRKIMPGTMWTMVIGGASLAGIFPLAGFWSKDEILATTAAPGHPLGAAGPILLAFALITVFLTAFYTFRMIFLTFFGTYRGQGHPHESPRVMVFPLVILAVPAALAGLWGSPVMGYGFQRFLEGAEFHAPEINYTLALLGLGLALLGIALAAAMYVWRVVSPARVTSATGPLHRLLANRYYVDELYTGLIGVFTIGAGQLLSVFDRQVLDGIVNGLARATRGFGSGLRTMQTGRVQNYGLALFGGVVAIALAYAIPSLLLPR